MNKNMHNYVFAEMIELNIVYYKKKTQTREVKICLFHISIFQFTREMKVDVRTCKKSQEICMIRVTVGNAYRL